MTENDAKLYSRLPAERWQAAQLVWRQQQAPPFSDELTNRLIALLGDSHAGVRTYARKALDRAGPAVVPHLKKTLQLTPGPYQLAQIALLVGKLSSELLLSMITDKRVMVKVAILQAMAQRPDTRYISYQLQSLRNPNGHIRYHAALGIARQELKTAPDELFAALQSDSVLARGAAMYALGKIGDPQAVGPLVAALQAAIADVNIDCAVTAVAGQPMTREEWQRFSAGHGPIDLPMMATQALVWIGKPAMAALHQIDVKHEAKLKDCIAWAINEFEKK